MNGARNEEIISELKKLSNNKMKQQSIYLEKVIIKRLEEIAKEFSTTKTAIIRTAIQRFLKDYT